MHRKTTLAAIAAVLLLAIGAMLIGRTDGEDSPSSTAVALDAGEGYAAPDAGASRDVDRAAGGAAADGALETSAAVGSPVAPTGPMVVKTATVDVEVPAGAFDRTVGALTSKVIALGGHVSRSTTDREQEHPSGSLVLRVPSAQLESVLGEVRGMGEVRSEEVTGTEVGAEHADLQARLRATTATRDRLTAVLAQADQVDEILMVQDRITAVQTQIEQLQGQIDRLDDQVAMASLSVTLGEPGADRPSTEPDERGLGDAWDDARHRFGDGIESLVAGSGTVAFLLLVAGLLGLVARVVWPRIRRSPGADG